MITAKEIKSEIKEAIKQFGEYSYYDKGPHEVMNLSKITDKLADMPVEDVANLLVVIRKGKYGEEFVREVLHYFQDDSNMDKLFEDKRLSDLY